MRPAVNWPARPDPTGMGLGAIKLGALLRIGAYATSSRDG